MANIKPGSAHQRRDRPSGAETRGAAERVKENSSDLSQLEFERSLAVVIGINDYRRGIPPLHTARPDAERLAKVLAQNNQFQVDLLIEDVSEVKLKTLLTEELPAKIKPDDRLIFYFAGHGLALNGDDGPAGYLIPQDADAGNRDSFLPMQFVHDALTELPCRHCLIILDCCFSGAFRWSSQRSLIAPPDTLYQERYERFVRSPAWQVLTSAAYDQAALDTLTGTGFGTREDQDQIHSPFAQALFDALEGQADANGDGVLVATELYLYLRDNVEVKVEKEAQHYQTPGLWPLNRHDKGEFIFLLGEPDLPPAPEPDEKLNPYRGLQSYDEADTHLFFGRTALIKQLADVVTHQPLTVVLGVSGTGKSSLVKAGLLPYLRDQRAEARARANRRQSEIHNLIPAWHILLLPPEAGKPAQPLRPTGTPLRELLRLLAALPGQAPTLAELRRDPLALKKTIERWQTNNLDQKLLLVIDQFEELVTLCRSDAEREQFMRLLVETLTVYPDHFRLVLTLRSDFEPQVTGLIEQIIGHKLTVTSVDLDENAEAKGVEDTEEQPAQDQAASNPIPEPEAADPPVHPSPISNASTSLRSNLQLPGWTRFIVPPMTQAELREVIEGPANEAVLYFDPSNLVDKLINEVIQTPGALPLLSFTLSELYMRYLGRYRRGETQDRALIEADYDALGGVIGSLRNRATEEYDQLDENHRATLRRIMLRMIAVEAGELARRRVPRSELIYADEKENQRVERVLRQLIDERLLVSGESDGEAYVEPAHDALVRAWDKLLIWSREAEEYLPLQRRLMQAAIDWGQATEDRKEDLLWHDNPRLAQLQQILDESTGRNNNGRDLGFFGRQWQVIFPSTRIFESQTWLNRKETAFVRQSIFRKRRDLRRLIGTVAAVIVVLTGLTIFAFIQQGIANEQRAIADTERIAAITSEANAVAESNARATEVIVRSTAEANAEERRIAAVTAERQAEEQRNLAVTAEANAVNSAATAEAEAREARRALSGQLALRSEAALEMSPQQSALLAIAALDVTRSYDEPPTSDAERALRRALGTISGRPATNYEGQVCTLAVSADRRWIVTAHCADGFTAQLWDLSSADLTARPLFDIVNGPGQMPGLEELFLADSGPSIDNSPAQVELPAQEFEPEPLDLFDIQVQFSHDGRWLVMANILGLNGDETIALVWDLQDEQHLPTPRILAGPVFQTPAVTFTSNNRWLVAGSDDGNLIFWDLQTDQPSPVLSDLPGVEGNVMQIIASSNGRQFVTIGDDTRWVRGQTITRTTTLWQFDPTEPALISPAQLVSDQPSNTGYANLEPSPAVFSPDGRLLAASNDQGQLQLWRLTAAGPVTSAITLLEAAGAVRLLKFSPDSRWLIAARTGQTNQVVLWDLAPDEPTPVELEAGDGSQYVAAFSPDARWLVYADGESLGRQIDLAASPVAGQPLDLVWQVGRIEFSRDSQTFATTVRTNVAAWTLTGGEKFESYPSQLQGHENFVDTLAIDPEGRWLFTASDHSGTTRRWDLTDLRGTLAPRRLGQAEAVTISKDHRWLIAAMGREIKAWDLLEAGPFPTPVTVLDGLEREAESLAVNHDLTRLAVGHSDGSIMLWQLTPDKIAVEPDHLPALFGPVTIISFTPDGRRLAAVTEVGESPSAYLWSLADLQSQPIRLTGQQEFGYIVDLTIGLESRWLVTVVEGYGAEVWDLSLAEAELARQTPVYLPAETAAFSPDGHWLATGGNREITLYDLTAIDDMSPSRTLTPINLGSGKTGGPSLAFTDDSRQLIAAPERTRLRVWDLTAADPAANVTDFPGQGKRIEFVGTGRSGNWWVGAGQDGPYQLWPVRDGIAASEPRLIDFICCGRPIGIGTNDRWLVTLNGSGDSQRDWRGTLYLWQLDLEEMVNLTCETVGRNLNTLEWSQYFRDEQPRPICPDFPFDLDP